MPISALLTRIRLMTGVIAVALMSVVVLRLMRPAGTRRRKRLEPRCKARRFRT
jgi:hypothetical protein